MRNIANRPVISILLLLASPIAGLALGVGLGFLLGLSGTDIGNFIANFVFLLVVLSIIPLYRFSSDELGLKLHKSKLRFHIASSLAIFTGYLLFYLFVIQISGLKPVTSSMIWGLMTYLVVVVAEELYFRGEVYGFIEKRSSAKWALLVSSVLFGVFHARQGLLGIITKTITGTALMQLWEQGLFGLDDDINNYLPFSIRNPAIFPGISGAPSAGSTCSRRCGAWAWPSASCCRSSPP